MILDQQEDFEKPSFVRDPFPTPNSQLIFLHPLYEYCRTEKGKFKQVHPLRNFVLPDKLKKHKNLPCHVSCRALFSNFVSKEVTSENIAGCSRRSRMFLIS